MKKSPFALPPILASSGALKKFLMERFMNFSCGWEGPGQKEEEEEVFNADNIGEGLGN